MNLSANTIELLKSFSNINPSIFVREGNILSTCSPVKSIYARTSVEETFAKPFAIYELNKFLGIVSLFEEPTLSFSDKMTPSGSVESIIIESATEKYFFTCADPSMVISPPEKELNFPSPDVEFNLNQSALQKVIRASNIGQLPEICITGNGSVIEMTSTTVKTPTADNFKVAVGETDKTFTMIFKADNIIKLISTDYNVKLSSKNITKFESTSNVPVVFYIAAEPSSKFGE